MKKHKVRLHKLLKWAAGMLVNCCFFLVARAVGQTINNKIPDGYTEEHLKTRNVRMSKYGYDMMVDGTGESSCDDGIREVKCKNYYESGFTGYDARTGTIVTRYQECRTLLEKVKKETN